jgi:hypothetical protein
MSKIDVGIAILQGAFAKKFAHALLENPYPDAPGCYVLHKAWRKGFLNSETVLLDLERRPPTAAVSPGAPPFQAKRVVRR